MQQPEVVCLTGSTRFEKEFHQVARRLTLEGKIILTVHVFRFGETLSKEELLNLDYLHLHKIDMADRVHVVNIGGYQGDGTKREIQYALVSGKQVTYEEP